jgi:demethylmenaquinone methyltransferase/2-methoxy-6-polyprenyl-1,4-benzoquinol methylase
VTDLSRTFGNTEVEPAERERRIRRLFQHIAPRYDLMNDLMSFGVHRIWKRAMVWAVDPRAHQCIVDVAGGTGDVAKRMAGSDRHVIVCDPSLGMMRVGRRDASTTIAWLAGAAEALPIQSNSVDTVTIAFGIRNVTKLDPALGEVRRILKPGGRLICLEFSRPWRPLRWLYDGFSRVVIPRLGAWVARDRDAYRYLVESIRRFPDQEELRSLFETTGFVDVTYKNLSLGVACIHLCYEPGHER